ncbi:MAG: sulfatase-like hydrolase/transferase [Rhizobiales bacterium]|nr:sulfatase-like hydrolase/transferase [Hyphomicrobiales bacterium]
MTNELRPVANSSQPEDKSTIGRRGFLSSGASLVAAAMMSRLVGPARAANQAAPNIIYIVADDLGWKDVGFHGSDIKTPNIDKLAAEGARLEQFYAQPMCTPTRAALMTGRYPLRYGLQSGVIPSAGGYGLSTEEYLLPQMLKDAGYETALVGKWHLGHGKTDYWPRQRGFDHFYGALVGEIDHFKHASHGVRDWYRNNKPLKEKGFDNTLFGQEAARLVSNHDTKKPLFIYLAFTAPHSPFQAPEEYIKRYAHIEDEQRRLYSAMVSVMDDEVGRVVAALEKKGMRENTVIVFQSDNGGVRSAMFAGESKVGNNLPADNGPYRDGKGTVYEGGTRVCGLINWPGHIKAGEVNGMLHVVDMYPTIAGLAGAKTDKSKPLDGMNVWETVSAGKESPRKEMVYNVDPTGGAVREGDMKLVWIAGLPGSIELFDLSKDPGEKNNIAAANPHVVKKLQEKMVALSKEMNPPLLMMEAIKLTFGSPPVVADPATMFNQLGD